MSEAELVCPACGAGVFDIDVTCRACQAALTSEGAQRLIGETVLGLYTITGILGQGGMSVVYEGKHSITGQEVALKVLPPDLAAYSDLKSRFLEEGRALAKLDHPNIVHLYNFGSDGDSLVLAMQYVRGKTWERLIMEQLRLSWQLSTKFTCEVARALNYAHGCGIIHRDMKPSNVLIRDLDGAATVMDFGIAKVQSSAKLTATGQTMGTVRYMSPEQVRGKDIDLRTDIYSLAMTAYESIVGDTPFSGDTHFEIMSKHLSEMPVAPSLRGIDVPPALEAVLMRAIAKDPEQRQGSAKEFTEQLEAALARPNEVLIPSAPAGEEPSSDSVSLDRTLLSAAPAVAVDREATIQTVDIEPLRRGVGGKGLLILAAGLAVAALATLVLIRARSDGPSSSSTQAEGVAAKLGSKVQGAARGQASPAFLLPGMLFAVDKTYPNENLRIISVAPTKMSNIHSMVLAARSEYALLSKEQGWPPEEAFQRLTLVLVPQATMCNSELYRRPSDLRRDECPRQSSWYRPVEHTLYLVPAKPSKMQALVKYSVSSAICNHAKSTACMEALLSGQSR